jgi:hypothetical protein
MPQMEVLAVNQDLQGQESIFAPLEEVAVQQKVCLRVELEAAVEEVLV